MQKGKSKRLPFPTSRSRAQRPLDLVHSDLDKMPVLSIGGYKYTTTYLDDHSSFGVMFYLKHKNKEFTAFKAYKSWAKRQLGTKLKCKQTDCGGEFMSNEQKAYLTENSDESTHQILSYGLLFSTFYHFPYTADPPTWTTLTQPSVTFV